MKTKHAIRRRKKKPSNLTLIILSILAIVLIGDVLGAMLYLRQSPATREGLITYVMTGESQTFFQIFWQQFVTHLTLWTLGFTIVGNGINVLFLFMRGMSAGFNLAFLIDQGVSTATVILWFVHYFLVLVSTMFTVYFSLRFAYIVIKSVLLKKYKLVKKQAKLYVMQLVFVLVLVLFIAVASALITPFTWGQLGDVEQIALLVR